MGNVLRILGAAMLLVWAGLGGVRPSPCTAQQRFPVYQNLQIAAGQRKPSMTESISSSLKQGVGKLTRWGSPKTPVKSAPDVISLSTKATPKAKLYVSLARLREERRQFGEAGENYQKALKLSPNNLSALLGYARVKDRQGKTAEAARLYDKATESHPNEASVYNNLGAFYGRHGKTKESAAALQRAIQLQPNEAKYRNNLALVLVEMGRTREAFEQLRAVSPEAVAYYNLGFLLNKKGQFQAAAEHFAIALRIDPSMVPARQMLQRTAVALRQLPQRLPQRPPHQQQSRPAAGTPLGSFPSGSNPSLPTPPPTSYAQPQVHQLPRPPKGVPRSPARGNLQAPRMPPNRAVSPQHLPAPRRLPPTSRRPAAKSPAARPSAPAPPVPPPAGSWRQQRTIPTAPLPPQGTPRSAMPPLPAVR